MKKRICILKNRCFAFGKNRKEKVQGTVLRQYFLTYFTVLSIPVLICCLYYIWMLYLINEDDIKARQTELEHTAVLMDTMLDEFEHLGNTLTANGEVNSFKNAEDVFHYPNTYKVYKLRSSLSELYQINQSVFDYFIFFDKSETVINKTIAYTYEEFYELYLHEARFRSYEEWYGQMQEDRFSYGLMPMERYVYKEKENRDLLVYTRPLIMLDSMNGGRIHIYLEERTVDTLMPAMANQGIQYIENGKGEILYFRGELKGADSGMELVEGLYSEEERMSPGNRKRGVSLAGKGYLMLSHTSAKSGLTYHMLLPQNVVNNRMISSLIVLSLFIVIGISTGILLSYHMSLKTATPINDMLNKVSQVTERFEGHQSVFSSLKTTFNYLLEANSELEEAMERQKPYIRNAFINRLIYGSFVTEDEAAKIAANIGFPFRDSIFAVLILRFSLLTEQLQEKDQKFLHSCTLSLLEMLEKVLPESLYTHLGDGQVALILSGPEQEDAQFRQRTEEAVLKVKEAMPSNISEKLFVYGGSIVRRLEQVQESFRDASYMFDNEYRQIENTVVWYQQLSRSIPSYPSQDIYVKLSHYVTAGDWLGLHDLLEDILKKYIIENNLPHYLQHMLLNELQTILFRIIGRIGMEEDEYRQYYNLLEESHNAPSIVQITTTLNLYRQVCEFVGKQKKQQDSQMAAAAIAAYIDANYGDDSLCLTSVADMFSISEPYLSNIFKQTQGINFSTYVEVVRIDKAKDFLKTTALSIGEISGLVGYSSTNSFCRAFKRVTGISASEYRKK